MTLDKSLKVRATSARSRNVLTRAERIARLKQADRWTETTGPLGLPKVRVYKIVMKKKKKAKTEEAAAGGDKKKGADKKGAAPAAAAKKAAPAKKAAGK